MKTEPRVEVLTGVELVDYLAIEPESAKEIVRDEVEHLMLAQRAMESIESPWCYHGEGMADVCFFCNGVEDEVPQHDADCVYVVWLRSEAE